jgi:hypothetical protein
VVDLHAIRLAPRVGCGEPATKRVVDDLLHGPSLTMYSILQESNHVRVERQGGRHAGIMARHIDGIKMPPRGPIHPPAQGGRTSGLAVVGRVEAIRGERHGEQPAGLSQVGS